MPVLPATDQHVAGKDGSVRKSILRNSKLNGCVESVGECLECIVAEMLKWPLNGKPVVRTETGHRCIPVCIRLKNGQRMPSEAYILPPNPKKLKNQVSHYISENEELKPKKRAGARYQKARDKSSPIASFAIKRRNPHLSSRGGRARFSDVFPSSGRKKQFVVITLGNAIRDNGFHKGKGGKKLRPARKD